MGVQNLTMNDEINPVKGNPSGSGWFWNTPSSSLLPCKQLRVAAYFLSKEWYTQHGDITDIQVDANQLVLLLSPSMLIFHPHGGIY